MGDGWTVQPIVSDVCIAMEAKAVECVTSAPQEAEVFTIHTFITHISIFISVLIV